MVGKRFVIILLIETKYPKVGLGVMCPTKVSTLAFLPMVQDPLQKAAMEDLVSELGKTVNGLM